LEAPPAYLEISTQNIVDSLSNTLSGVSNLLTVIPPNPPVSAATLPTFLTALNAALGGVISAVQDVVSDALSPLLDPLLTTLLSDVLGTNLGQTEVGARLSCSKGAELVY
jgi:hypothetical protein